MAMYAHLKLPIGSRRVKLVFQHEQFPQEFPLNLVTTESGRVVEAKARTTCRVILWPELHPNGTSPIDSGLLLAEATAVCARTDQFSKAEGCKRSLQKVLKLAFAPEHKAALWEAYAHR